MNSQEKLGKILVRLACPPEEVIEDCAMENYDAEEGKEREEVCAECWLSFVEPVYYTAQMPPISQDDILKFALAYFEDSLPN